MTQGPPLLDVRGAWVWKSGDGACYSPPSILDYRGLATSVVEELAVILQDLKGKTPTENRRMLIWLRDTLQKALTNVASHTAERCADVIRNTEFPKDEKVVGRTDLECAVLWFGGPDANARSRFRNGRVEHGSVIAGDASIPVWDEAVAEASAQIEIGRGQKAVAARSLGSSALGPGGDAVFRAMDTVRTRRGYGR